MNHLPYIKLPTNSNISVDRLANISFDSFNTPFTSFEGKINVKGLNIYPKKGLVVFLDALGIKGIWQKEDPQDVITRWNRVWDEFKLLEKQLPSLNVYGFSDTIIITSTLLDDGIFFTLNLIGKLLIPCFIKSIENRIFLRGSITYGKFFESSKISIGPAVDECALLHNSFDWIGISFLFNNSHYPILNNFDKNFLIYYQNIPYKEHNNKYNLNVCLNWPSHDKNQNCRSILITERKKMNEQSKQIKYDNTIRFYDTVLSDNL
jgi:hypothetical protein